MARRTWRRAFGGRHGIRNASRGHGLVGRHRPQPLRPPGGSGIPRCGVAACGSAIDCRDERKAGIAQGVDRGVRLHGTGEPVAGHGRGALRKRAGGARGARPVRRGAAGSTRRLAAGRDVRTPRCSGRPGRSPVETAGDLRARVCSRGALVEPRHPAGRGARSQPGRDRGGAHRRRVQPGGWPAPCRGTGRTGRGPARRGGDGGGVRTRFPRRPGAGRAQCGLRRHRHLYRRRQRGAAGRQRPRGGDYGDPRSPGGTGHSGRTVCARAPPTTAR